MSISEILRRELAGAPLGAARGDFEAALERALRGPPNRDATAFEAALAAMPVIPGPEAELDSPVVRIGTATDLDADARTRLHEALLALHPWRKGPFELLGVPIDSEWRSDLKWARVAAFITPLAGRRVLDVGCGNGYYAWRMLGAGAGFVLGVDPAARCIAQFQAFKRQQPAAAVVLLPLGGEDLPAQSRCFDTVFSMGVIYHRRDPIGHLRELHGQLRPGGELVLETLFIDATAGAVLAPGERYAKMRNVWSIPSCNTLLGWLHEAGFRDARIAHTSITTADEQRRTAWMRFESLADFLDPRNPSLTVEGHPAPRRALAVATA